jgi:Immunoglobulin I-set domain
MVASYFIDELIHFLLSGSLQILNSEESDQGRYECVAENILGADHSATINLYVRSKHAP